ncbi:flagellar hook-length control protein FliK [Rhizobium sp. KVB221]|uniref:Flagellar hook-length control protein FliK n=1 Tax=Rhizobium setariae TaxID=2801340 RepID=A0A936YIA1_9HYPH|nr:flagellar hook-length control protein FliK [Rhizobium setariae]MBL0370690.1 flagellar hook-length control protein FliK [Rhizobium setariae]
MTAIDQSAIDLAPVRGAKANGGRNHAPGFGKDDKGAKSFDDLVAQLEQKLGDGVSEDKDIEALLPAIDATAEEGATTKEQPSRIRLSNFDRLLRSEQATDNRQAPQNEKVAPTDGMVRKKADLQKLAERDAASSSSDKAESASEQLTDLLDLTADTVADKASTPHKASNAKSEPEPKTEAADAKPDHHDNAVADALKAVTLVAENVAVATPTRATATNDAPKDEGNDTVRLVSADCKGRPVDIALPEIHGDDEANSASASSKVDLVTVLDARRYLGFETQNNADTLARAIKGDSTWTEAMRGAQSMHPAGGAHTATTVNTLKLQMNPDHLGPMIASLRLKGDELSVEVRVETVEAYRQLSNDQDVIVKALKDQGFAIDQVTIQLSAADKNSEPGQDRGNQASGGQDLRDSQGQNAKQREENARRAGNQGEWHGSEQSGAQSDSSDAADGGASGNLYL